MSENNKLVRGLGLKEATALNMIDMVGIGPFVTIPLIIGAMHGPQCIIAWIFGAVLSYMDGTVWAELGAAYPEAGGSYIFLQKLYGPTEKTGPVILRGENKFGRMFSFLYIWQTTIQAPLVIASGAIGFAQYLKYLIPDLNLIGEKMVSGGLIILLCILLYRNIKDVGKISVIMWIIVGGTLLWLIYAGLTHFNSQLAFTYPKDAFDMTPAFFIGLGAASTKTIYSYLGYYNVCHLGGEIKDPQKNIPRSIFISITGIVILYLLMQICVLGVIPWQEAANSTYVVSTFFERIYGMRAAQIATVMILFVGAASLFSGILGYSRIPYAAAVKGDYFKPFAKLHSTKHFPHVSLLILCGVAFVFSLLFKLKDVITTIVVMRIFIQFIGQAVGLIILRFRKKELNFPYKMPLFPIPAMISILLWLFIFVFNDWRFMVAALGVIALGVILFFVKESIAEKKTI